MSEESITVPDAKTIAAYESTHYFAHEAKPVLVRVGDPAKSHQAVRMVALRAAIEERELRSLPASGEDPAGTWQPEPGFCVFDVPADVLDEWLMRFRQNAAVQFTREDRCRLIWHPAIRLQLERAAAGGSRSGPGLGSQ